MRSGSAAASAAVRVRMVDRASKLAEAVQRLGRDEAKALADDLGALWRGDSTVGDRLAARLAGIFREVGLVTRDELDEAELKVAQLEHRLQLLENKRPPLSPPAP
jgi:polyhydroxyalkanoate synthesis regulator phasin